ncbi:serine O-acetyltransferase [Aristaeella lactis]|uniref:Serine O-acetyltransferase n=1 Tax=Aristaeella lactis TaxID=3046383 RepID=A0AC61PJ96_9FIRM|nr:hypothetical protein [Aristaeella lactis]QUA54045.1 serine acetyltransferase [Aristaeella lactis]SMC42709.1 serine O-acetyltransferase [Aristaeella lactis]
MENQGKTFENKKAVKKAIQEDNTHINSLPQTERFWLYLIQDHRIVIKRYMKHLRYEQYYREKGTRFIVLQAYHARRKNRIGNRIGFFIESKGLDRGITIWHHGTVIINGAAHIGSGTVFHGDNCVGTNGKDNKAPTIGKNVDIGFGASVIGDVVIADNCKIGAGAVVVHSCDIPGATLVGVPARVVNKEG